MLALVVTLSTGISVFAIDETIRYTSKHGSGQFDAVEFTAGEFTGTCAEAGVVEASSGTATTQKVSNSSNMAIVAWYIYRKGYDMSGSDPYPGFSTFSAQRVVMHFMQIAKQGKATWKARAQGESMGYDDNTCNMIFEAYDTMVDNHASDVIPDSFAVYFCNAGNDQDFVLWGFEKTSGKLKLKKASALPSITG